MYSKFSSYKLLFTTARGRATGYSHGGLRTKQTHRRLLYSRMCICDCVLVTIVFEQVESFIDSMRR